MLIWKNGSTSNVLCTTTLITSLERESDQDVNSECGGIILFPKVYYIAAII